MTIMITYGAVTQSIADWIREGSASPNAVYKRLKDGYDIMAAIHTPMRESQINTGGKIPTVFAMFEGQKRPANEIAEMTGWSGNTIRHYIRAGKPIHRKPSRLRVNKQTPEPAAVDDIDENMTVEELMLNNLLLTMTAEQARSHIIKCNQTL